VGAWRLKKEGILNHPAFALRLLRRAGGLHRLHQGERKDFNHGLHGLHGWREYPPSLCELWRTSGEKVAGSPRGAAGLARPTEQRFKPACILFCRPGRDIVPMSATFQAAHGTTSSLSLPISDISVIRGKTPNPYPCHVICL